MAKGRRGLRGSVRKGIGKARRAAAVIRKANGQFNGSRPTKGKR